MDKESHPACTCKKGTQLTDAQLFLSTPPYSFVSPIHPHTPNLLYFLLTLLFLFLFPFPFSPLSSFSLSLVFSCVVFLLLLLLFPLPCNEQQERLSLTSKPCFSNQLTTNSNNSSRTYTHLPWILIYSNNSNNNRLTNNSNTSITRRAIVTSPPPSTTSPRTCLPSRSPCARTRSSSTPHLPSTCRALFLLQVPETSHISTATTTLLMVMARTTTATIMTRNPVGATVYTAAKATTAVIREHPPIGKERGAQATSAS